MARNGVLKLACPKDIPSVQEVQLFEQPGADLLGSADDIDARDHAGAYRSCNTVGLHFARVVQSAGRPVVGGTRLFIFDRSSRDGRDLSGEFAVLLIGKRVHGAE